MVFVFGLRNWIQDGGGGFEVLDTKIYGVGLRKWFEKWFEKLDTRGGGGFEKYSVAWFENIVLNLLDEFIGQPPFGTEGRCSPFGGGCFV